MLIFEMSNHSGEAMFATYAKCMKTVRLNCLTMSIDHKTRDEFSFLSATSVLHFFFKFQDTFAKEKHFSCVFLLYSHTTTTFTILHFWHRMCEFSTSQASLLDTYQLVSYNSIQFWYYLPGDSIRSHRLRSQSHKTAATLDINHKSPGCHLYF